MLVPQRLVLGAELKIRHSGVLDQGDEGVERKSFAFRDVLPCFSHQRQRTIGLPLAMKEFVFLQSEQPIERGRVAPDQFFDLHEFEADAFERGHLMQPGKFRGAVDAPARRSAGRSDESMTFVDAERAHAHSEPTGGFCGGVMGIGW